MLLVCSALVVGALLYLRYSTTSSASGKQEEYATKIEELQSKLKDLMRYVDSYLSRTQYQSLMEMLNQTKAELDQEKNTLREIESKLDTAQKMVEEKEGIQQDLKSAKEEDELKLQKVMEAYTTLSQDCILLEQKLAASLKELDKMLGELELTPDQRSLLEDLSKAITTAGGIFRDLITEYAALNERLAMLQQQHQDLEDEYTKLVEQQLGE